MSAQRKGAHVQMQARLTASDDRKMRRLAKNRVTAKVSRYCLCWSAFVVQQVFALQLGDLQAKETRFCARSQHEGEAASVGELVYATENCAARCTDCFVQGRCQ